MRLRLPPALLTAASLLLVLLPGSAVPAGATDPSPDVDGPADLADLRTLAREDDTARLVGDNWLLYADPAPTAAELARADAGSRHPATGTRVAGAAGVAGVAGVSADDAFDLHSNPGALRTILLDFDGQDVSGTVWNHDHHIPSGWHAAWDPAGNGSRFSTAEREQIVQVWASVAEDYAPFDVDVTTRDPGFDALNRADAGDQRYGARVLLTSSIAAATTACAGCAGLAFRGAFGERGSAHQPAWVFSENLRDQPKLLAETASHEAGHQLGLSHDGTTHSTSGYDLGHGAWAPIMGVGYFRPITQWSRGDYPGADNHEDDVALLAGRLALRHDEAGAGPSASAPLPAAGTTSYLTSRGDVDSYAFGPCRDDATLAVSPAGHAPNLDVHLTLRDASGKVLARADPDSAMVTSEVASGMAAKLQVPAGRSFTVQVDGVGHGSLSSGYDDYGSLGAYAVAATGCAGGVPVAPAPTGVSAVRGDRTALVSWSPAPVDGSGSDENGRAITGYEVTASPGGAAVTVGASAGSARVGGLTNGVAYTFTVRALVSDGASAVSGASAPVTPAGRPARMARPRATVRGGRVVVGWRPPSANGAPVLGYVLQVGARRVSLPAGSTQALVRGLARATHRIWLTARNDVGSSLPSPAARVRIPR